MYIETLRLQNFRNHIDTRVDWGKHINVITGPNGSGKTSIIDAIHYLCMSRSFVSNSDKYVLNHDSTFFMLSGQFRGQIRSEFEVSCTYSKSDGKNLFVNESPLERFSDLIGMVPIVVLSPSDRSLTREGPSERRTFLDSFISQISKSYLKLLIEFKKIIKQRNSLLQDFRGPMDQLKLHLEPWDAQLAQKGAKIIAKRTEVLEQFQDYLEEVYQRITDLQHRPNFVYQTICPPSTNASEIEEQYREQLADKQDYEIERELTTLGPHRDEVVFYLDDFELRKFGSQGQHRLFTLSLKLAQLFFYSDELDDLPIFLLDDVFGDLDANRTRTLLKALAQHAGQVFVTSAAPLPFDEYLNFDGVKNCSYHVEQGNIKQTVTS